MFNPASAHAEGMALEIKDSDQLYAAYMPFLKHGGLFVPTMQRYALGEEVILWLTLPDAAESLSIAGKVAWITPMGAQRNRIAGIGVHFNDSAPGKMIKTKIEALLVDLLHAERPTQTM